METSLLREKLHTLINSSSEEKLMEVYAVFEDEYSDKFKNILEEEYTDYERNGESISKSDLDKAIEKLLYCK